MGSLLVSISPYLLSLIALLALLEQLSYLKKKRFLPGPSLVLPFLGNALSLVRNPTSFWDHQSHYAKSSPSGFSANYIIGRFILFIHTSELSHKVFNNVRPDAFHLIGHPFGKRLFGDHNLIYMFGQDHKNLRRRMAPNFTPKALSTYTSFQQRIIQRHLIKWEHLSTESHPDPIKLRFLIRDMNLETSQTVFVGPYLSQEARERFKEDYNLFNLGLMNLPIDLPGFSFRKARLAVSRLVQTLADCATQSKSKMLTLEEPTCLVDFWMQELIREQEDDVNHQPPPHTSDTEIGGHLFDFLFAAQDASTSSLLWAVTLLDSHPHVLSNVRTEVSKLCSPITADQLRDLEYTEAVAREVVRYRAPATLVPHIASEDFQLTETYTVPKGTVVFPSVFDSSFQGFTDPDRFDPDRFLDGRQEDKLYKKNYLAFGAGPHQCVGQRYAMNHLVLFIAMFASILDFQRPKSDGCDDIEYVPTICPKDGCMVFLKLRDMAQ